MYLKLSLIFLLILGGSPALMAQDAAQETAVVKSPETASAPQQAAVKKPDEITLEANLVQIILNDEHRGGVDWGAIVSDFHTSPLKKGNDPAWSDPKHRLSFGTVSQDYYAVLLDALDTVGQMSQFPQQPVKVTAGIPANIQFDKQDDIQLNFLLARLKSGELSLNIEPNIRIPATEIFNGERVSASVLLQTQTRMSIANDTTIVIGGLMKEEEITRKHKFPLLGDIPIVGRLVFYYKGRLMQRTETVLFLTVHAKAVEMAEEDNSI